MFPNDESDTASNAGHKSLDHDKSSFLIIKREQPSEGSKTKETGKGGNSKKEIFWGGIDRKEKE